jgi:serine/threonine-protein kinase
MEYVPGVVLRSLVGRDDVPVAHRVRWLVDVARALAEAHRRGVVHRDVKPENVMVSEDGLVKVLDFGIARRVFVPDDPTRTQPPSSAARDGGTRISGTPGYMSPEQVRGQRGDGRSDQFAWGVLCYEVLSGVLPWKLLGSSRALMQAIVSQTVPALASSEPVPAGVIEVVRRALEKDGRDRFPTMDEAADRLEAFAAARAPLPETRNLTPSSGALADRLVAPTVRASDFHAVAAPAPASVPTRPDTGVATVKETLARTALAGGVTPPPATDDAPRDLGPPRASVAPVPKRRWAFALATVFVGAAGVLGWRLGAPASGPPAPSAPTAASVPTRAVRLIDLPIPPSPVDEARKAYAQGLAAYRDAAPTVGVAAFLRAATLDPDLAPALLRAALWSFVESPQEGRALFARAFRGRALLDEHDAALLDAVAPSYAEPSDWVETSTRLARMHARFAGDYESLEWWHWTLALAGKPEESIAIADRMIALDPDAAVGWLARGDGLAYLGDLDRGYRDLERCVTLAPAQACFQSMTWVSQERGDCVELTRVARRWIAAQPSDANAHQALAAGLAATGEADEAVEKALAQAVELAPRDEREELRALASARIAAASGRFREGMRALDAHERELADEAEAGPHVQALRLRVSMLAESGDTAGAAAKAEAFLRRKAALVPDPRADDWAIASDPTPALLAVLVRAGKLRPEAARASVKTWVDAWLARVPGPVERRFVWAHGYAASAVSEADGREAIATIRQLGGPPPYQPDAGTHGAIGRAFLLGGDLPEATRWLGAATRSCSILTHPVETIAAARWLGEARERAGDRDGACATYADVVRRWGTATPRSVSATEARDRARSLGCPTR